MNENEVRFFEILKKQWLALNDTKCWKSKKKLFGTKKYGRKTSKTVE